MPPEHGHAEPLRDPLETGGREVRLDHGGEEQRVEDRVREADAGRRLLELQEAHVERAVVRHEHGVLAEAVELREDLVDRAACPRGGRDRCR